jgi:Ca2+-binding RTX toxin-like protein
MRFTRLATLIGTVVLMAAPLQECGMPVDEPLAWAVPESGNRPIDALAGDYRWSGEVITYSLPPQDIDTNGVNDWDEGIWRSNIAAIFDNLDSFLDVRFEERPPGDGQINLQLSAGPGFLEGRSGSPDPWGDGTVNTRVSVVVPVASASTAAQPGDVRMLALWHEVGHALGMAHPFITTDGIDDGNGSSLPEDALTEIWYTPGDNFLNSWSYTVMTYRGYFWGEDDAFTAAVDPNTALLDIGPGSYSPFDVATLQYLYGKNTQTGAGNDTYRFNDDNLASDGLRTIWDTAGIDTIDYTGTRRARINLNDATLQREIGGGGFLSTSEARTAGFHIANGVIIENAIGGPQGDVLVGNEADNTLTGLGGNDILQGEAGNDLLIAGPGGNIVDGGTGSDTVVVAGPQAGASITNNGDGTFLIRAQDQSTVLVSRVETVRFDDSTVTLGAPEPDVPPAPVAEPAPDRAPDVDPGEEPPEPESPIPPAPPVQPGNGGVFTGTSDSDNLAGTNGDDTILGLERSDYLYGYGGNDTINTGPGSDFVFGGDGVDTMIVPGAQADYTLGVDASGTAGNLLPVDPIQILQNFKFFNDVEIIVFEGTGETINLTAIPAADQLDLRGVPGHQSHAGHDHGLAHCLDLNIVDLTTGEVDRAKVAEAMGDDGGCGCGAH